jgi:hypothetical protein
VRRQPNRRCKQLPDALEVSGDRCCDRLESLVHEDRLRDGTIISTILGVAKIDKTVAAMRNAPQNISYNDLRSVCVHFFGEPRQSGTSHAVFKTPWPGDPRVNIQKSSGGKAKPYQVRQILKAIDKLSEEQK